MSDDSKTTEDVITVSWEAQRKANDEVREAQLADLRDAVRHRAEYERLLAESNATQRASWAILERNVTAQERQADALERIADSLAKPPLTFVPIRNEP